VLVGGLIAQSYADSTAGVWMVLVLSIGPFAWLGTMPVLPPLGTATAGLARLLLGRA
jgi:hypothetical protein